MKATKNTVPILRFKGFSEDYLEYKLGELINRYSEHNKDEEFGIDDILSLSSKHGIVDRKELLEDTYENVNHLNYIKTGINDFVYGKSISANYPYGLFKVNKCRDGLLSTLYFTFKVCDNVSPTYLDYYFSYNNRANNFLKKYVLVGDRYITADANFILSGKIFIPQKQEQERIVLLLNKVDDKIGQLSKKIKGLQLYKKGVLQKIFTEELKFKDEDGSIFPKWEKRKLGDLTYKVGKKNKENIPYPIYSINNQEGFLPQSEQFDGLDSNDRGYDISLYKIVNEKTFAYNPARINVGSIGYSYDLDKVIVSSLYVCFKTNDELEDLYLLAYLDTDRFNKDILRYEEGGVRQYLFYDNFSQISIPLPSNNEQIKIAEFLAVIDKKIKKVNVQLAQTKHFKKGLLQQMFV